MYYIYIYEQTINLCSNSTLLISFCSRKIETHATKPKHVMIQCIVGERKSRKAWTPIQWGLAHIQLVLLESARERDSFALLSCCQLPFNAPIFHNRLRAPCSSRFTFSSSLVLLLPKNPLSVLPHSNSQNPNFFLVTKPSLLQSSRPFLCHPRFHSHCFFLR